MDEREKSVLEELKEFRPVIQWVVLIWMLFGGLPVWVTGGNVNLTGPWGDTFGVVSSLFSGLAFAGVICALTLQRRELKMQRDQVEEMRKERETADELFLIQPTFANRRPEHHQIGVQFVNKGAPVRFIRLTASLGQASIDHPEFWANEQTQSVGVQLEGHDGNPEVVLRFEYTDRGGKRRTKAYRLPAEGAIFFEEETKMPLKGAPAHPS